MREIGSTVIRSAALVAVESRDAPVAEAEGGREAEHAHPEYVPAVGTCEPVAGGATGPGQRDDNDGADGQPGQRKRRGAHVLEDDAGRHVARSVYRVGDEQDEVSGGHPAEFTLQSHA